MPRIAMATSTIERVRPVADSDDEASMTRVDDLIQRGRSQGHLSLAELRNAFDEAGLTPAEGRSILRELSEAGVRLANELAEDSRAAKSRPARAASAAQRSVKDGDDADSDDESDLDVGDADVVTLEAEAAALAEVDKLTEVDLDDQTPATFGSHHVLLQAPGRNDRQLDHR